MAFTHFVPEGHPKIAQPFKVGLVSQKPQVPQGRLNSLVSTFLLSLRSWLCTKSPGARLSPAAARPKCLRFTVIGTIGVPSHTSCAKPSVWRRVHLVIWHPPLDSCPRHGTLPPEGFLTLESPVDSADRPCGHHTVPWAKLDQFTCVSRGSEAELEPWVKHARNDMDLPRSNAAKNGLSTAGEPAAKPPAFGPRPVSCNQPERSPEAGSPNAAARGPQSSANSKSHLKPRKVHPRTLKLRQRYSQNARKDA